MQKDVQHILSAYIREKQILSVGELAPETQTTLKDRKDSVFVTLYQGGNVVASSGRIHTKAPSSAAELIENTLLCLQDSRLVEYVKSPDDLDLLKIRVDVLTAENRRVIADTKEADPRKHGLILIAQEAGKAGIILPNIAPLAATAEDLFFLVKRKAGFEGTEELSADTYVLYAFETERYGDL